MIQPNTVNNIPEPTFRRILISMLSGAMLRTGRGFRLDSPKRAPRAGAAKFYGERRPDKVGTTKLSRRLAQRVQVG